MCVKQYRLFADLLEDKDISQTKKPDSKYVALW